MERTIPGPVRRLEATLIPGTRSVRLAWAGPTGGVLPTKYFILRFRVEPGGARRWSRTVFVPPGCNEHVDDDVDAGTVRYYVGALGPAGSGRPAVADVTVAQ